MTPFMQTYMSGKMNLLNPRKEDVTILDIAVPLSRICRFNGHTTTFYSVAQHSVACCELATLEYGNYGPDFALACLLHDAAESYVGDIPSPVKHLIPSFQDIEHRILRAIYHAFDILFYAPPPASPPVETAKCRDYMCPWEVVRIIDRRILFTEKRDVLPDSTQDWDIEEATPANFHIIPQGMREAQNDFTEKLHYLLQEQGKLKAEMYQSWEKQARK